MSAGRNDPCPCGSGKKHKQCCLNANPAPVEHPQTVTWRRIRRAIDGVCQSAILMQDVRARRPRELLPGPREGARPEDNPQVRAQVQAMIWAHFEQWPQMKLPGLGNRTALVLEAERGARRMDPPVEEAVLANLRRRLGLDQPGQ